MYNKKAAMFGIEAGALRKQSGGLFLAKLRRLTFRLVEGHQATRVKTQSGAMFGLDARIALAIFGALSVISGAALYSAIQESKVTSFLTELTEIEKALESYYIDTGGTFKVSAGNPADLSPSGLVVNRDNIHGWKGPYISLTEDAVDSRLSSEKCSIITLPFRDLDAANVNCASAMDKCRIYIYCDTGDDWLNMTIKEKVDGSVNRSLTSDYTGKVQYRPGNLFYKTQVLIDPI